ncbi:MAG TPA: hypothetical protein PLZ55_00435 [bacterium]|nr:hypothetical protein [bacterium]HPO07104.1 hypothetical protein [bacterium]HQO36192.1 hypothetical protein [bacterium]HQP98789.1 hypothetical protein [bacterium]
MGKEKRFLRDLVLDQMLRELREIQTKAEESEDKVTWRIDPIIEATTDFYETNKFVLQHIEAVIESIRNEGSREDDLNNLVVAAAHLRMGITQIHSIMLNTVEDEDETSAT